MSFWVYPDERYYYGWYGEPRPDPTDGDIKAMVVDRLRENPLTKDHDLRVDVKQRVVILGGTVPSPLAKRVAGDDAWDTPGVVDVSNQLAIAASDAGGVRAVPLPEGSMATASAPIRRQAMREIMVGVDGSEAAVTAARWAATVARATGAEVVVASTRSTDQAEVPPDRYGALRAEALDRLEHEWSEPAQDAGVPWRAILCHDASADALLASANEERADLLVVGTHGAGRGPAIHLGSVAHQLSRHTTRPLAIVPDSATTDRSVERIVIGVDGSPGSDTAVSFCAELAPALSADTTAVLARQPLAERVPLADTGGWRDEAAAELSRWTAPLRAAGVPVEERIVEDPDAADAIAATVHQQGADLIVVGTHGLSEITGLRLGGVATAVLDRVNRPVVLVPPNPEMT